jgi:hypothetical protein
MNSHVNYLMATQRTAELLRTAENARLANAAKQPQAIEKPKHARTVLRVRLRNAAAGRLRVRRA